MPRPTPSQARTNRLNRQAQRRAMGVDDTTASGMASTLRRKIHGPGVKGYALKDGTRRPCTRYTRTQVIAALADYRPRKATYKDTRTHLLALAA